MNSLGRVSLVGGGPGDPELITVRGRDRLSRAQVVIFDELVGKELLAFCPPECLRIHVGKRCGNHATAQPAIIELMLEHARAGREVVRLKGGDPFIFGRGGEELSALLQAGIPCEVVPGVTAAAAAGAAAGVPLTHRDLASAVIFLTGHENPAKPESSIDWSAYARTRATLCIYMGTRRLAQIAANLLEGGLAADTPVALISRASRPDEHVHFLKLQEMPDLDWETALAPTLAIIGAVAGLPEQVRMLAAAAAPAGT